MNRLASLALMILLAAPLAAQQNPYAFFSTNDKEPVKGKHGEMAGDLLLRPNNEVPYYVYVHNPTATEKENLIAVLAEDEKGERILAEGPVAKIAGESTARVLLTLKAPKAPVPEKSTAPAASALTRKVYLLLMRTNATAQRVVVGTASGHTVTIMSPKDYLSIDTRKPSSGQVGKDDLSVTLGDKGLKETPPVKKIRGGDVSVALNVRTDLLQSLDPATPLEGTFKAKVAPGEENIVLVAKNLKFLNTGGTNYISVSADGVSNAFVYKVDLAGTTPTSVEEKGGFVRASLPRFAVPGKPVMAKLEIFGDSPSGTPRIRFTRIDDRSEPKILASSLTAPRDEKTSFRIGSDGELLASSEVKDWEVPVETAGLTGACKLTFELENSNPKFAPGESLITFDSTGPEVAFINKPKTLDKGKELIVSATAIDKESGVKSVLFYIGEPPVPGKKPAPGTTAKGELNGDTWTGKFEALEPKSRLEVGVIATNNVDLSNDANFVLAITDPANAGADGKPKADTGTIEGRVVQGSDRGQPKLEVVLKDADGKAITTTKSDGAGNFKFEKVKPGSYTVAAAKPIDYAKGEEKVTVVAGETAKPTISLKR